MISDTTKNESDSGRSLVQVFLLKQENLTEICKLIMINKTFFYKKLNSSQSYMDLITLRNI